MILSRFAVLSASLTLKVSLLQAYGDLEVIRELLEDEHTIAGLGDAGAHVGNLADGSCKMVILSRFVALSVSLTGKVSLLQTRRRWSPSGRGTGRAATRSGWNTSSTSRPAKQRRPLDCWTAVFCSRGTRRTST
eukprot:COSAG04_NODE_9194_length_888_cov_1.533587_3_plen_134_part_00